MPALPESATSKAAPHGAGSARILVVSLSWLGDCVMAMPALSAFRRHVPGVHITVLAKPAVADLWLLFPNVDAVIPLKTGFKGMRETVRAVRKADLDFAYVLPKSFRSAWIPFLARVPGRRGLRGQFRNWMLTESAALSPEARHGHQQLEIADILRMAHDDLDQPPFLKVPEEASARARATLAAGGPVPGAGWIALFPGASRGPSKRWPAERFAEVGRRLVDERHGRILVLGSEADRPVCERVAAEIGSDALNLAGQTDFLALAALLGECRCVVANDSGGMHLAAALGIPLVGIFGMTDPEKTAPVGTRHRLLAAQVVDRSRDIDRDSVEARTALSSIPVDEVYYAVLGMLK